MNRFEAGARETINTLTLTRRRRLPCPTPANAILALAFARFNNTLSVVEKTSELTPEPGEGTRYSALRSLRSLRDTSVPMDPRLREDDVVLYLRASAPPRD